MVEFSCLVGVSLVGSPEKWDIFMADPFTFEPAMTEENGGVYWDCARLSWSICPIMIRLMSLGLLVMLSSPSQTLAMQVARRILWNIK